MSYIVTCGAHKCRRQTAHKDPKYAGPCHVCIEKLKDHKAFQDALNQAAKMGDKGSFLRLDWLRPGRWKF